MPLFGPPNVEKLKAKGDVQGLIKALGYQKDARVRQAAAEAMGQIRDAHVVEPLVAALKDADLDVWRAVHRALVKIGEPTGETGPNPGRRAAGVDTLLPRSTHAARPAGARILFQLRGRLLPEHDAQW